MMRQLPILIQQSTTASTEVLAWIVEAVKSAFGLKAVVFIPIILAVYKIVDIEVLLKLKARLLQALDRGTVKTSTHIIHYGKDMHYSDLRNEIFEDPIKTEIFQMYCRLLVDSIYSASEELKSNKDVNINSKLTSVFEGINSTFSAQLEAKYGREIGYKLYNYIIPSIEGLVNPASDFASNLLTIIKVGNLNSESFEYVMYSTLYVIVKEDIATLKRGFVKLNGQITNIVKNDT